MISFTDGLGVLGGHGMPQGLTEPQSFLKDPRFTDGRGWTNEFHIYNFSEGNSPYCSQRKPTFNIPIMFVCQHLTNCSALGNR